MEFNILGDVKEIERHLNSLQRKHVPYAASRAINRTADSVKSTAVREISTRTKIKQKDVRGRVYVRGANPFKLTAVVEAYPLAPNLKHFRPNQNKVGTAASAWEQRKTYRHAFIHPKTGSVVTRTTKKRFPLKGLRGPSVPNTFARPDVVATLDLIARQRWQTEFTRELSRRLGQQISVESVSAQ